MGVRLQEAVSPAHRLLGRQRGKEGEGGKNYLLLLLLLFDRRGDPVPNRIAPRPLSAYPRCPQTDCAACGPIVHTVGRSSVVFTVELAL